MKKNIIFVRLQEFPPNSSIDMYYYAKYLGMSDQFDIDVIVGEKKEKIKLANTKIHETWLAQKNNFITLLLFFWRTIQIIKRIKKNKQIDYVYFFSMHPISILIQGYVKYIYKLKTIYDVTSGPIGHNLYAKISYISIKLWIRLSHKYILIDQGLYSKLQLRTKKPYEIIWMGYDEHVFYPQAWVDIFHKQPHEIIFTYIGTLNTERNLDIFIQAFIENIHINHHIKLYFVWSWTWEEKLKHVAQKYINKNIFFLWKKEHSKIPDYINSSDVMVSYIPKVSYFDHQPPTKLIEYLACNKPCIATNTAAQEEILKWYEHLMHQEDIQSTKEKIKYFIQNKDALYKTNYISIVKKYNWWYLVQKISKLILKNI